jgi:aerobic-type carbon monoxide dehydrogenase small subunit (CoxS/CutS family)
MRGMHDSHERPAVKACSILALQAQGAEITTIEGLSTAT